jgi:hypothetical protein
MTIGVVVLLVLSVSLALLLGLMSVIRALAQLDGQGEPVWQDTGPIAPDQCSDPQYSRSQFAWQSRSHSRAPD